MFICYDGDFAGQKGAVRGLEILRDEGVNVRVVPLPEGLDPDDVIKQQGPEGYRACLDAAMPLVDFKLDVLSRRFDLSKTEERRAYTAEALKVIAGEESASVREDLLKALRDKTGTTYESLRRDLENAPAAPASPPEPALREDHADRLRKACRFILASLLFDAKYARGFDLSSVRFDDPVHALIADHIRKKREAGERVRASALFEIFDEDNPELAAILDLSLGDRLEGTRAEQYFADCVRTLERENIDEQLRRLSAECDAEADLHRKRMLTRQIAELSLRRANM